MGLLNDTELYGRLKPAPRVIEGLDMRTWDQKESHIQPCSVDLHIGQIFVPGEEDDTRPGTPKSRTALRLITGQTAVVVTEETLHLPKDLAGIGFPPSHVSAKGLLMTNPGHIDPGYEGKLRFTVINMSADEFRYSGVSKS